MTPTTVFDEIPKLSRDDFRALWYELKKNEWFLTDLMHSPDPVSQENKDVIRRTLKKYGIPTECLETEEAINAVPWIIMRDAIDRTKTITKNDTT